MTPQLTPLTSVILQNSEEAVPFLLHDFSAFGLALPSCWAICHLPMFCLTQKNHAFIQVPVSRLQLRKGRFHFTEFLLGNLSSTTPPTISYTSYTFRL